MRTELSGSNVIVDEEPCGDPKCCKEAGKMKTIEQRLAVLEAGLQIALGAVVGILSAAEALNVNVSGNKELMAQLESLCNELKEEDSELGGVRAENLER